MRIVIAEDAALFRAGLVRLLEDEGHQVCAAVADGEALLAAGRSNAGVAAALVLTLGTVEKHVASIFGKLGLPACQTDNRRVLAVLRYLGS